MLVPPSPPVEGDQRDVPDDQESGEGPKHDEERFHGGALTLRERDVMWALVPVSSASRVRILRRSPPWRPIEADVLASPSYHDADEGYEQQGERDREREYPAPDRCGHGGTISQFTGVSGSLENLSLRRARFDSGDYPKCQPWACIKAKNAPRIPATNPMMVTTVFHLRRRGETRGELARSAEAFR